jgi:hypothetical protein
MRKFGEGEKEEIFQTILWPPGRKKWEDKNVRRSVRDAEPRGGRRKERRGGMRKFGEREKEALSNNPLASREKKVG